MIENKTETTETTENTNVDYIAALEELRANSVPKAEADRLRAEAKRLTDALVKNQLIEPTKTSNKRTIAELVSLIKDTDCRLNNIEYVEAALELRQAVLDDPKLKKKHGDLFVPNGERISATEEDYLAANRVAEAFKECIDYARGDSDTFTTELKRITKDTRPHR